LVGCAVAYFLKNSIVAMTRLIITNPIPKIFANPQSIFPTSAP